jgi:hypothetical protein
MKVRLREQLDHQRLSLGKEYLVVGLDDTYFRLVDDDGEPVLHEKALFDILDSTIPTDWITRNGDDGDYYTDPPELAAPGFYERWHDRDPSARAKFAEVFDRLKSGPAD